MKANEENLLDKVLLSPRAVSDYHGFVRDLLESGALSDVRGPEEIPTENARVCESGELEIFLFVKGRKLSFLVPKEEWAWA